MGAAVILPHAGVAVAPEFVITAGMTGTTKPESITIRIAAEALTDDTEEAKTNKGLWQGTLLLENYNVRRGGR